MKRIAKLVSVLSLPLILTSCHNFGGPFDNSMSEGDYRYHKYDTPEGAPANPDAQDAKKHHEHSRMSHPGESNVKAPHPANRSAAQVSTSKTHTVHEGPSVPSKAPVVGQ